MQSDSAVVVNKVVTNKTYAVTQRPFGEHTLFTIENRRTREYVSILSQGGRWNELVLRKDGINHSLLKGFPTYVDYLNYGCAGFYGANLFPFPGRIDHGRYSFAGKAYRLPANDAVLPHALHGLVHDQEFERIEMPPDDEKGVLLLTYEVDGSCTGYPFQYGLEVRYQLDAAGFTCTTTVTNRSATTMPAGHGWHPYLAAPGHADALQIQLASQTYLQNSEKLIPTGEQGNDSQFLTLAPVGNRDVHACFVLNPTAAVRETVVHDPVRNLFIGIWQETGPDKYNYLQLYIPPDRQSIAIEPYTCPCNGFNSEMGLITISPGESKQWHMGIRLPNPTGTDF